MPKREQVSSESGSDNENSMFIDGEIHIDSDDIISESELSEYRDWLESVEAGWYCNTNQLKLIS